MNGWIMLTAWGGGAQGLANMPNSFSPSSHLETKDFIGLLIWMCAFSPAILIRPERLQVPFAVCFAFFCSTISGLFIWYVLSTRRQLLEFASDFPGVGVLRKPMVQGSCLDSLIRHQTLAGPSCSA